MSWKQTQTEVVVDEGVETTMMFMDEWAATHRSGPNEGSSRQIPNLLNLTLNSSKVSS